MADDDWDLGAVVRGRRTSRAAAAPATPRLNYFASFTPQAATLEVGEQEDDKGGSLFAFPDLFRRRDAFQELEELYKLFFKGREHQEAASLPSTAPHTAAAAVEGPHQMPPPRQPHRLISHTPRSKRRKNLQKKVVCHVPAAGLSSDVWAWRKYGQKPIKGSPYPRGYYRCSSSKACLARKQVERSWADPAMFIITYTAEHNHPVPTHRNSLAGSTRHKFPSPAFAAAPAGSNGDRGNASGPSTSLSTAAGLSPTTPLTVSMEDELLRRLPQEAELDGEDAEEDEADEEDGMLLLMEDMEVAGEDDFLFMGVAKEASAAACAGAGAADASAFSGDDGGDHFFTPPWLSNSKNAAAAAGGS